MRIIFYKTVISILAVFCSQAIVNAQVSIGNGASNWINVDDVKRDGGTLTFSEVQIDGNGFLIIHPFENGAPNGDRVVATAALKDGKNENVEITVHKGLDSGEMFIVMLHSDSNDNGVLDFIFVDAQNVMDKAVFEDSTMIGHAIPAP
jgi:hypothetical protein